MFKCNTFLVNLVCHEVFNFTLIDGTLVMYEAKDRAKFA